MRNQLAFGTAGTTAHPVGRPVSRPRCAAVAADVDGRGAAVAANDALVIDRAPPRPTPGYERYAARRGAAAKIEATIVIAVLTGFTAINGMLVLHLIETL